ncbi:Flp pilus assembly complex ATPase component TadA [Pseudomonas qingdaonensis]|uniref:Flp pilus assembly complex ATPase component TadA n=1 Tax=Pseudomonas qingdaonensis TaxID=2056231 RepID=A0ABX8DUE1_9PSED|nr:ATPase, T2SS/T4P/T4SS family [Pseudomonas qingdaonensis]QVL18975.1 Flp pilus assembly complex ATPase component TadA [Pseudomonas qingdaonensis]
MDVDDSLVEHLVEGGSLTRDSLEQLATLRGEQPQSSVSEWLLRLGLLSEAHLAQAWSATLGWQRFDPQAAVKPEADLPPLPLRFLHHHCVVPVGMTTDGKLKVGVARPAERYALRAIMYATGLNVLPLVGTRSEIEQMIETLYGRGRTVMGTLIEQFEDLADPESIDHLKDLASEAPVIRLVNLILQRAMDLCASDVHIEPFEKRLNVRYRVDGLLREAESPPVRSAAAVISRIKIMARLDIAERRLPQDGRIALHLAGRQIDLRVSTLPTSFGESVALRLLDRTSVTLDFSQLGFTGSYLDTLLEVLEQPNGILLVTGPTGCGKTTTLYTALARLNTTERKIITVEDPVEYQIDGVNQLQVKPAIGLDFATALRSIVRQDPDVIMIGEIRDLETCRIAIQSALTGHLVLSTLHTNSACASITRLLDMGAESYLLASTLNGVLAQRLLRRLDPDQCEAFEAPPALVREHRLEHYTEERPIRLFRPRADAAGGGYRGRVVVSELLVMSERIRAMLMERVDSSALERVAREEGLRTLYEDGLRLALTGVTSLEEVLRVTRDEGEQAA